MRSSRTPKIRLRQKLAAWTLALASPIASPCFAVKAAPPAPPPPACIGVNARVGTFRLLVAPSKAGPELSISSVNVIQANDKLKYEPVQLPANISSKARIALVIVPAPGQSHQHIEVLNAQPARSTDVWTVPMRISVVGVVFGPRGLDVKKVSVAVKRDPDLIPELATYAKQTATVNALVQTLSQYEQAQPGSEDLNAVLGGFSTQYNVALPQLNTKAPADQQATLLLQGVLPSLSYSNPSASQNSMMVQQSAGLATAVAGLFYGTPIGLVAGGAQLIQNLRLMMFPNTDFRPAFIEPAAAGDIELCSPNQPPKPRTRIAYLWMLPVPDAEAPSVSIPKAVTLPLGSKSTIAVTSATRAQLSLLPRAHGWRLISPKNNALIPVAVKVGASSDELSLNLSQAKIPAGSYHLDALWDWKRFEVAGTLHLRAFSNFAGVKLTPESEDRLVQGTGPAKIEMSGADFEFVNGVDIVKSGDADASAQTLSYTIPKGKEADPLTLDAEVNTSKLTPGAYSLLLRQSDGKTQTVPVTIHPPDPKLEDLPLRANLGEKQQVIVLHGLDLERIAGIESHNATWTLAPLPPGSAGVEDRLATISLHSGAHVGDVLSASIQVEGLLKPVEVSSIVEVAGPLPEILSVKGSFPSQDDVALQPGEIPAGAASFAIRAKRLGVRPTVEISCSNSGADDQPLKLQPGDQTDGAQLDYAGEGLLFLSFDPGAVGQSGCLLTVTVSDRDTGTSMPYNLGRVIHLPRIDKFTLTDRSLGGHLYVGILTGQNLQVVEQTGWNARAGYPVQGIPTPVPGAPEEQTLEIELHWPPPSPHAPVYVWLLGETQGRRTSATY